MDTAITRAEHEEFRKRIEEENHRQNRRIENLEKNSEQIGALVTSVEKLAISMEQMAKEQEKQGKRLETLEGQDGDKWKTVVKCCLTGLVTFLIGYVLPRIFGG
ncbi:MAG: hypothetical protein NC203_09710 [Firmicutes bacterium]|nr:hypothetical protein [[Eubacterium] siraeum]MCM1488631.1 hypothetical protein [Bacillota bacterium]